MRGSLSVGPILGRRWPKPFGRLGPTCVRRRRVPIASQCRPVERKSDVGEEVTTAAEPTFWMIFNLQNQTTDRATPTDRRSRHASGQKLRDCEDAGCSTCGRFARRARVSAGNDPTTPPLRQRGIWPHSHAWLATGERLTATPNQRFPSVHPALATRGVSRSSRTLERDAVDAVAPGARIWSQGGFPVSDQGALTNSAFAYGKTVWSWHPLLVSSRRRQVGPTGSGKP